MLFAASTAALDASAEIPAAASLPTANRVIDVPGGGILGGRNQPLSAKAQFELLEEDAARQEAQAEIGRQLAIKKNQWSSRVGLARLQVRAG